MRRIGAVVLSIVFWLTLLMGCGKDKQPNVGIAFGVGPAARWKQEIQYMEEYAMTAGIDLQVRFNTDEAAKPLAEDCYELIDQGIDVLIIRPRDVFGMKEVVDYAHEHKVKIISYDSLIENEKVDLFVGYDSENTGQNLGVHLAETVPKGDYILLWGDMNRNIEEMYTGAMKYFEPLKGDINIILEGTVPGWSPEEAKKMVKEAVAANGNHIDAIFAFNDKLAGAGIEAIKELGITEPVAVAGMDAELDAVKRVVAGEQECTAYMNLKKLSDAAMEQAVHFAKKEQIETNAEKDNGSGAPIPAYLLTRQLVTKLNVDRVLIESGYYTEEQVYGMKK